MHFQLQEKTIQCPYCWESIGVLIDPSDAEQTYVEDCQVCCRPINFYVQLDSDGDALVSVSSDDE